MFYTFCEKFGVDTRELSPIYEKHLSDSALLKKLWSELFCGFEDGYKIPLYRNAHVPSEFYRECIAYSQKCGIATERFFLAVYMALLSETYGVYRKYGINDSVFDATAGRISDYAKKNYAKNGVYGLSDYRRCSWYVSLSAFRLGELEYQACTNPYGAKNGLKDGEIIIKIHVPENCDLSEKARKRSYDIAYGFFSERLGMKRLYFACESWLLSPEHADVIKDGNIVSFAGDFEIIETYSDYSGDFLEHIFNGQDVSSPELLSEQTRLQKYYKNKLISGEPFYSASGIFTRR